MNNLSKLILSFFLMYSGMGSTQADRDLRLVSIKNESKYPVVVLRATSHNGGDCYAQRKLDDINKELEEGVSALLKSTFLDPAAVNEKVVAVIDRVLGAHHCESEKLFEVNGQSKYSYGKLPDRTQIMIAFKDFDKTYKDKRVNPVPVAFLATPMQSPDPIFLKTKKEDKCLFGVLKICNDGGLEVSK